jgi:hypothetical protein
MIEEMASRVCTAPELPENKFFALGLAMPSTPDVFADILLMLVGIIIIAYHLCLARAVCSDVP